MKPFWLFMLPIIGGIALMAHGYLLIGAAIFVVGAVLEFRSSKESQ